MVPPASTRRSTTTIQLGLRDRARPAHRRPEDTISAGKSAGRFGFDQWHLYVRGQSADYDTWAQLGCRGWSWDDCCRTSSAPKAASAAATRRAAAPARSSSRTSATARAERRLHGRQRGARAQALARLQQRRPGGHHALPEHDEGRTALEPGRRLSAPCDRPPESESHHPRSGRAYRSRRQEGRRHHYRQGGGHRSRSARVATWS